MKKLLNSLVIALINHYQTMQEIYENNTPLLKRIAEAGYSGPRCADFDFIVDAIFARSLKSDIGWSFIWNLIDVFNNSLLMCAIGMTW